MNIDRYNLRILDRKTAVTHAKRIAELLEQIPKVAYTSKDVISESKDDRTFYGKWEHSLVLFDKNKPIAVIIGYERKAEGNEQYPVNTLYISEIAVAKEYQKRGIGRNLISSFIEYNNSIGMKHLNGKLNYSVQTNSAKSNMHVQKLYKSLGFIERSIKQYDNRKDIILEIEP